jgi:Leucine-rich repeat (LRR) protein
MPSSRDWTTKNLEGFEICFCNNLTDLPPEIGMLSNLKTLGISSNDKLESRGLPPGWWCDWLGRWRISPSSGLQGTIILHAAIPAEIGRLVKLHELKIRG